MFVKTLFYPLLNPQHYVTPEAYSEKNYAINDMVSPPQSFL